MHVSKHITRLLANLSAFQFVTDDFVAPSGNVRISVAQDVKPYVLWNVIDWRPIIRQPVAECIEYPIVTVFVYQNLRLMCISTCLTVYDAQPICFGLAVNATIAWQSLHIIDVMNVNARLPRSKSRNSGNSFIASHVARLQCFFTVIETCKNFLKKKRTDGEGCRPWKRRQQESNLRPSTYKVVALPTEIDRRKAMNEMASTACYSPHCLARVLVCKTIDCPKGEFTMPLFHSTSPRHFVEMVGDGLEPPMPKETTDLQSAAMPILLTRPLCF